MLIFRCNMKPSIKIYVMTIRKIYVGSEKNHSRSKTLFQSPHLCEAKG
jgi:hypothetical protein